MPENRIYLNCPYEDKDLCKQAGGRWDALERKWFITSEMDITNFSKWMPGETESIGKRKSYQFPSADSTLQELLTTLEALKASEEVTEQKLLDVLSRSENQLTRARGNLPANNTSEVSNNDKHHLNSGVHYHRLRKKFESLLSHLDTFKNHSYRSEDIESFAENALFNALVAAEKEFLVEFEYWAKEAASYEISMIKNQEEEDKILEQLMHEDAERAFLDDVLRENMGVEERAQKYGMDYEDFEDKNK